VKEDIMGTWVDTHSVKFSHSIKFASMALYHKIFCTTRYNSRASSLSKPGIQSIPAHLADGKKRVKR
jgi:hypothetical protein